MSALLGTSTYINTPSYEPSVAAEAVYDENSSHITVIYELDMENPTTEDLENASLIIEQRLGVAGYNSNKVEVIDSNRISVKIYNINENEEVTNEVTNEVINEIASQLTYTPELSFRDLDGNVYLTSDDVEKAEVYKFSDSVSGFVEIQVLLTFTEEGKEKFYEATEATMGSQLLIMLGDEIISMPSVTEAIKSDSAVISGNFTIEDANYLASLINASINNYNFNIVSIEQSAIVSN